jgi:prevent-host-death family protein
MVIDHGTNYIDFQIFWRTDMQEMIPISKFKATCLRLLDNVKKTGNSIIVTRKGEPIALVTPPPPQPKSDQWLGSMKDSIKITGDIISPVLDESEWEVLKD